MKNNNSQKMNVLLKELYFKLNQPLDTYIDVIEEHEVHPQNFFEIKYDLYKTNVASFNTFFKKDCFKETLLLFNNGILCAVFYKFEGNQLDYFHDKLIQYLPKDNNKYIFATNRNSKIYKFSEELLMEVLHTENGTTGICAMNSIYRLDQLRSVEEMEHELKVINHELPF